MKYSMKLYRPACTEADCMDKVDGVKLAVFFLVDQKVAAQKMKKRIVESTKPSAQNT